MEAFLKYVPLLLDIYKMRAACSLNLYESKDALVDFEACAKQQQENNSNSSNSNKKKVNHVSASLLHYNIGLIHYFNMRFTEAVESMQRAVEYGSMHQASLFNKVPKYKSRIENYISLAKKDNSNSTTRIFLRMLPREMLNSILEYSTVEDLKQCAESSVYLRDLIANELVTNFYTSSEAPSSANEKHMRQVIKSLFHFETRYQHMSHKDMNKASVEHDLNALTLKFGQTLLSVQLADINFKVLPRNGIEAASSISAFFAGASASKTLVPLPPVAPRILVTENVRELYLSYSGANVDPDYSVDCNNLNRIQTQVTHFCRAFPNVQHLTIAQCAIPSATVPSTTTKAKKQNSDNEVAAEYVLLFPKLTHFYAVQTSNYLPLHIQATPLLDFITVYGNQLRAVAINGVEGLMSDAAKDRVLPLLTRPGGVELTIGSSCNTDDIQKVHYTNVKNPRLNFSIYSNN